MDVTSFKKAREKYYTLISALGAPTRPYSTNRIKDKWPLYMGSIFEPAAQDQ